MIAFLASILVFASIAVVAWPLVKGFGRTSGVRLVEDTEVSELLAQKDAALLAISELESDYEMGNLSQSDYRDLRKKYEQKAVALLKTVDDLQTEHGLDNIDEEIEARVLRLRNSRDATERDTKTQVSPKSGSVKQAASGESCVSCGAPYLPDAAFCSRCGAPLSAKCPRCSSAVSADDKFCYHCGAVLDNK